MTFNTTATITNGEPMIVTQLGSDYETLHPYLGEDNAAISTTSVNPSTEPNRVWDTVNTSISTVGDVMSEYFRSRGATPDATAANYPPPATSGNGNGFDASKYVPWIIGGTVVLVLGTAVMSRRNRPRRRR